MGQFLSTSQKTGGTNESGYKLEAEGTRYFHVSWTLELKPANFMQTHVQAKLCGSLTLDPDEAMELRDALDHWLRLIPKDSK